jgi:hypothetical protein
VGPKWLGSGPVPEIRPSQRQIEHISATRFNNWYDAMAISGRTFVPSTKFADRCIATPFGELANGAGGQFAGQVQVAWQVT